MVIAVDFDGTIVEHEYPRIGRPIPFAIDTLLKMQKDGHRLLMWSVRSGSLLQEAADYCESKGLQFYAYNKNHPEEDVTEASRKLDAEMFIDDRNLGGLPDWGVIYHMVRATSKGEVSFENVMLSASENQRSRKKKNFFIRLGEMFEKDGY